MVGGVALRRIHHGAYILDLIRGAKGAMGPFGYRSE